MPTARAASSAAKKSTATAAKPTTRAAAKPAAAAKTAAKPAAKAAPATASRRAKAAPVEDDDVDLLAGMSDEPTGSSNADDDESFDLLSDMTEDGGTPWYPWDDEDQPDGIQGTVKYIGEVEREQKFGGGMAPYVEVEDKSDPDLIWAVRGYATVLANQLQRAIDNGLSAGDIIAIKYFGEKENRKGDNTYKVFKVVVKKR